MRNCLCIDAPFTGLAMPTAYSSCGNAFYSAGGSLPLQSFGLSPVLWLPCSADFLPGSNLAPSVVK